MKNPSQSLQLPTRKTERWKFTPIAKALEGVDWEGFDGTGFAAVDSNWSMDDVLCGVTVGGDIADVPVSEALQQGLKSLDAHLVGKTDSPFAQQHYSGASNTLVIHVARGAITQPIRVPPCPYALSSLVIMLEDGAEACVFDQPFIGAEAAFQNRLTRVVLGENSKLKYGRLCAQDIAVTVETLVVHMARDSRFEALNVITGGRLSRFEVDILLAGTGADAGLTSISVVDSGQLADTTLNFVHKAEHTTSRQSIRSVIGGTGEVVFQGKIHVEQAAQKTDAHQMARSLLLSRGAAATTKPELEIYADDVKCSHGAASGVLDKNAVFYLQSRGLNRAEAEGLLTRAFVEEAFGNGGVPEELGVVQENLAKETLDWDGIGVTLKQEAVAKLQSIS